MLIKKINFNSNNLINILIALIPLSLIAGNLITNLNVVLIILVGIFIYKSEIFIINKKIYRYLIYAFFLYLIAVTLARNIPILDNNILYKEHIIKSFLFLRFLLFFLIINKLVEKKHFNINYFVISCSFFAIAVGIDIMIQTVFGKNIFGYPITAYRPSSFFGSENVAGGFLQKFSLFLIVFIVSYVEKNKKNIFIVLSSLFFLFPVILTGNRMSSLLFVFSIIIFYLLERQFKKILIFFTLSLLIVFTLVKYPLTERIDLQFKSFYTDSVEIVKKVPELFYYNTYKGEEIINTGPSGYLVIFNSGVQVWKQNKIFGGGLKSFRLNCIYGNSQTCNSHPHNYSIELLVDVGIVGFVLIYLIFIFSFFDYFKYYRQNLNSKIQTIPFFLIIFLEFFPVRSTGSFFTTSVATVIFLMLAIMMGVSNSRVK